MNVFDVSKLDTISVLAGGWSAKELDLSRLPGLVIAINDSGVLSPKVDIIVTMDRLWLQSRWKDLCVLQKPSWARPEALINIQERPSWLNIFKCNYKTVVFSDEPNHLNGVNSAFCALNLAYQMRPTRILLFGFDMSRSQKGEDHWYAAYPWKNKGTSDGKYVMWAKQFQEVSNSFLIAKIEVLNASMDSKITAFPKVSAAEVLV